jgi:hypothetical protein
MDGKIFALFLTLLYWPVESSFKRPVCKYTKKFWEFPWVLAPFHLPNFLPGTRPGLSDVTMIG